MKQSTVVPMKYSTVYIAVRLSADGYEWADVHTTSGDPLVCADNARKVNDDIPQWAQANPVQRIERFDLVRSVR